MSAYLQTLASPTWRMIVLALLHTLGQAPLVAAMAWLCLRRVSAERSSLRYSVYLLSLALVLIAGLVSWGVLSHASAPPAGTMPAAVAAEPAAISAPTAEISRARSNAAPSAPSAPANPVAWTSVLAIIWLAGVTVMLARMAVLLVGAKRLLRDAQTATDVQVLSLLGKWQRRMGIARRIRVLLVETATSPAVLGIVRPTLLLPMCIATGLPMEQLEAIIAHELAHIRRHDYLVNLVQLAIEAVLFFNPAVWWLSRQIRIEREACCDALAAGATGQPVSYAEALASWVQQARAIRGVALGIADRRGALLERMRRLLVPGYRPEMRLSLAKFAVVVAVGCAMLIGLGRGAGMAVALAAEILTPQQRMEKLAEAQQTYVPAVTNRFGTASQVTINGTVVPPDDQPLPTALSAMVFSDAGNDSTQSSLSLKPRFSIQVPPGSIWIHVDTEGYAVTVAGPLKGIPGATIDGVRVELSRGFPGKLRFVDEQGKTIAGAVLTGGVPLKGGHFIRTWKGGDDGMLTIAHACEWPYSLEASAPGYASDKREGVKLQRDQVYTWTLKPAKVTDGVVVSETGAPIADATIRIFAETRSDGSVNSSGEQGNLLATTDETGHFTLNALGNRYKYLLLVQTRGHGQRLVRDVQAGQRNLRWAVGPELTIRGKIIGDLSRLVQDRGRPILRCQPSNIQVAETQYYGPASRDVPVQMQDDQASFAIDNLLPGKHIITAGGHTIPIDVSKPIDDLVIDLRTPESKVTMRKVIFELKPPPGSPPPQGVVELQCYRDDTTAGAIIKSVALQDGRASVDGYVGGRVICRPKRVIGCWFKEQHIEQIAPGELALRVDVPTVPAGAIVGRVLSPDGKPRMETTSVNVSIVEKPPQLDINAGFMDNLVEFNTADGTFMATPLPLGGTYVIKAGWEKSYVVSKPIKVAEAQPMPTIELRMVTGVDATVQVLDPQGKPAPSVPVDFHYESRYGGTSFSPAPVTDEHGTLIFKGLNPEAGTYRVQIVPKKDYQTAVAPLRLDGQPTVLRLATGLVLQGRVLDAATGKPLAGAEVRARPEDYAPGEVFLIPAEGKTDEQGRFRFSNLGNRTYHLHVAPIAASYQSAADDLARPADGKQVEIRIRILKAR